MKSLAIVFLAFLSAVVLAVDTDSLAIIPQPQKAEILPCRFELTADTKITFGSGEAEAQRLALILRKSTGLKLPVSAVSTLPCKSEIIFLLQSNLDEKLRTEGYSLVTTTNTVII